MTPARRWYRSPVFWFALPGLVFLGWVWVHSMHRNTTLDFTTGSHEVRIRNDGSELGINWHPVHAGRSIYFFPARSSRSFKVEPRPAWASRDWFPLPSYLGHPTVARGHHYLDIPYWFVSLVYLGLWQLPWLGRYFRAKRIGNAMP
ncbi:hypothetical protein OKA04_09570 [Luteolibacter flavescens]|uniref:DUF3592 domain-containing protein n=1 Tax=Luteolibacter flavescens TaxID=1859460 RepID=A0ABT3FP27_9BACT|nr:hypothetical protein [Luteolibacter flavescens]MCW1884974.1 hypothetical protein [Luteolibacter flavescens]